MKRFLILALAAFLLSGCVTMGEKKPIDYTSIFAKSGLNIDADSNDATDILYGGTNSALTDPGADRLMFWDDGEALGSNVGWLTLGTGLSISTTTLGLSGIDATDIADGTVTSTEFQYINTLSSNAQDQLDARALESIVGTSLNADDLELDGAILQTAAEIPHIDAAQTWTATQGFNTLLLTPLTAEPTEVVGQIYRADNDTWDPCGIDGVVDYFVICTAADTYIALWDIAGDFKFSSIATPTLQEDEWNDEADDRLLIQAELKNKIISNNGQGALHFDIPDDESTEGWNVIFIIEAAANLIIHPNDSANWYLNGTVLAADRTISNTAATVGESIACFGTEAGKVYCESKYADFVSAAE